ncbi:MAG: PD40 domain-containing protein [Chloroflexi bacterium]|nr:PD40 domain-containing protein [Chloroflexota bacterium]
MPKPTATSEPTEIPTLAATSTPAERLVYPEGLSAVFVNSDGSNEEKIELFSPDSIPADTVLDIRPSPDGRYLAFGAVTGFYQPGTYYSAMHIMDLQTKSVNLVTNTWNQLGGGASWSPDSRRLVLSNNRIVVWDNNANQLEHLTSYGDVQMHHLYSVWSPDGKYIVFACFESERSFPDPSTNNHGKLCIMHPDGTNLKVLVDQALLLGGSQWDILDTEYNVFAWSPDSQWIAYMVGDVEPDIAIVNIETGETRMLVSGPGRDVNPDWSPDGSRIVFSSNRNSKYEIFTVGANGEGLANLTPDSEADNLSPFWSPTGNHIAWLSVTITTLPSQTDITSLGVVMNPDGSGKMDVGASVRPLVWIRSQTP